MTILFAYASNWAREIEDFARGKVPAHRLFGYADMKKLGHAPLSCPPSPTLGKFLAKPILWRLYQAIYAVFTQGRYDCVFAVNEATSMPLLLLKRLGLLRKPVLVFTTALTHARNREGRRLKMWRWLLPAAEGVVSQTQMELDATWPTFGLRKERQYLMHMMVDLDFFQRDHSIQPQDYVLAVGTTEARDFPTLLGALPDGQKAVIVTDAYNAAIVEKHRRPGHTLDVRQAVPIQELRRMYQEARVIVTPLNDTPYGSGHTFLLENMVLGNVVIVTDVPGISEYFEDGVSALGVRLHDVADFADKLRQCLEMPEKFAAIRQRAPEWVKAFSSENFTRRLVEIATGISSPASRPSPPAAVSH